MSSKLPDDLPSGDYVIYSLIDGPLGIASIMGAIGRVPVIVPSPGFYPQKFHVEVVDEFNHIYVITVDGKNTRDEQQLVYASMEKAQQWVITYRRQDNAYTIVKLDTDLAWTDPGQERRPDRRDPDEPRQVMPACFPSYGTLSLCVSSQIRLQPLTGAYADDYSDIPASQLFKFEVPREQKLPSGNYKIYSLVSNQPLGIQAILGYRPDVPVVEPAQPRITSRADPVVVPVPSAAPQTVGVMLRG
ncbi:hypothetical protein PISMIDRAFT_541318 [Pisolithus microcarpus 441]|uniref:Uncharacterized protein n=1 Tax=Pisolithus microcarpus 441 TaxID=765257 RepID=A0A0C9YXR8_9AGAM|nr:hypothetical protein BKA83DRAFT_541318 [Pisolithus microcarpus]KIK21521.1 hypothetical protein PISMIDRAFT_541318 [Pisolithus microcarpus 441]